MTSQVSHSPKRSYLACDLGADSGRLMLGVLEEGKLSLRQIRRFQTQGTRLADGTLRWDMARILSEIRQGLAEASTLTDAVRSISVDSWGVDYMWVEDSKPVDFWPFHYRDERNRLGFERVISKLGRQRIFEATGIQPLTFNTLYQLECDASEGRMPAAAGSTFLSISDSINMMLSGRACMEWSQASTTQCFDPAKKKWAFELTRAAGIPDRVFGETVPSGTLLGDLLPQWRGQGGALAQTKVIAGCSHDTAAAVLAVPANNDGHWAYLSSGTWSLLGVELLEPLISLRALECGFTNEVGFGGRIRFLKNIAGLWLMQESLRAWKREGFCIDGAEFDRMAQSAEPLRSLINPNAPLFASPGDMPGKIVEFCQKTGQPVPRNRAEIARCILESLALLYAETMEQVQLLTGRSIERIHIVGGGSQSRLLNRFTASACAATIMAGPTEATALGNVAAQAVALGDIRDIDSVRKIVAHTYPPEQFLPENPDDWQSARVRFTQLSSVL